MMKLPHWLSEADIHGNAAQLGSFAVYLWQFGMNKRLEGNTYSTICGKLCAVRWYHKSNAGYDPGVSTSHAILLRGIRRFTDPVLKQHPVSAPLLRALAASLDLSQTHDQLLWGGILLAYFFLLRRSEYLFIGSKRHNYILKLGHIRFFDDKGSRASRDTAASVGIKLQGAKNNQYGREECCFHSRSGDPVLCPVLAAQWIFKAAQSVGTRADMPALSTSLTTGITANDVSTAIKTAAIRTSQDPSRFSTHSIRIGGATALLNAGADRLVIKLLGRWLSNAFEAYPVLTAEGSVHLSRLMS